MPSKFSADSTAATSAEMDEILSEAPRTESAVVASAVELWARMPSSSDRALSACASMAGSDEAVPTSLPPVFEKPSSASLSCGIVVAARSFCKSVRAPVVSLMALLTEDESPVTVPVADLRPSEICWSLSSACFCEPESSVVTSRLASILVVSCVASSLPAADTVMVRTRSRPVWTFVVAPSSARIWAMAASIRPWAQPTSPAMRPML